MSSCDATHAISPQICGICGVDDEEAETFDGVDGSSRRFMQKVLDPILPKRAEVEAHQMIHLPFSNWCGHCVSGRGMERPHRQVQGERTLPEFHFDFCFPGGEEGEGTLTVLVVRERKTRMTLATVIPSKSASNFVTRRVCSFMKELGHEHIDIIVKCDEENCRSYRGSWFCMALVTDVPDTP